MASVKMFAGTHVGLRENNEDNFTVCPDLATGEWLVPSLHGQPLPLGERGCLIVVADGMGGQNAGEVASDIAVRTVQEMFSPARMPASIVGKAESIKNHLRKTIIEADERIKARGKSDKSAAGLGSTLVMAWVVGGKAYVAWIGDSRAYTLIPGKGIGRLSKDHSYVQRLVDEGTLTDEEAMTHPNSNIITRSLGDTSQKAKPDVEEYALENGQVILLCSDGLCGTCRDEVIGGIVEDNIADLQVCKERLTDAALASGGSDNITIALLQYFATKSELSPSPEKKAGSKIKTTADAADKTLAAKILLGLFGLFLLGALVYAGFSLFHKEEATAPAPPPPQTDTPSKPDSLCPPDTASSEKKEVSIKDEVFSASDTSPSTQTTVTENGGGTDNSGSTTSSDAGSTSKQGDLTPSDGDKNKATSKE